MKKLILILIILSTNISGAQEELITFNNSLNTKSRLNLKDAIPVVNEKTKDLSLFLVHPKKIYGYLFNSEFKIIDSISSEDRSRKYKVLLGSSISENNDYRIFITNNQKNKFATVVFSYKNKSSEFKELDLSLDDETFLQTVTRNNSFYLFTIDKKTSIFNVYKFDHQGNYEKNKLDFSFHSFVNYKNEPVSIYDLLVKKVPGTFGLGKLFQLKKIDINNPNSIETTAETNKFFLKKNEIIFSFDENKEISQLAIIDLSDFETSVRIFEKPLQKVTSRSKKTNSYISENHVFLIASTLDRFSFAIYSFDDNELLNEYNLLVKDSIYFKNTPIIQKGGLYKSYREMEKTKKFLRKITNGTIGISAYKSGDTFHLMFGGKEVIQGGAPMFMPMGGGAAGGAISGFFNTAFYAYNSYSYTKATHIKGLFDQNFNHIKGEMPLNAFDKIHEFKDEKASNRGRTIFRYKDFYILGNSYYWENSYALRKFTD